MDTLQATILEYRLSRLSQVIKKRRKNADMYRELLNSSQIHIPEEREEEFNTYHTFVIQCDKRNELKRNLMKQGIETAIHYPVPIHLQPAASHLGYSKGDFPVTDGHTKKIITFPCDQHLKKSEMNYIIKTVNEIR